jgi:hypothetical protein
MRNRSALLASLVVLLLGAFAAVVLGGKPDAALARHPLVIAALQPLGVTPNWQTVVLFSARDTDLPPARVWAAWEKLEAWPTWSGGLVVETRWIDTPGWRAGARFEQVLDLGWMMTHVRSVETVGAADTGRLVSWWKDQSGVKSNHIWSFEPLPDGGSRIIDCEVLHGPLVGLARPVTEPAWQHRFDVAIDGLVLAARRAK